MDYFITLDNEQRRCNGGREQLSLLEHIDILERDERKCEMPTEFVDFAFTRNR